jgi:hypothetical protein
MFFWYTYLRIVVNELQEIKMSSDVGEKIVKSLFCIGAAAYCCKNIVSLVGLSTGVTVCATFVVGCLVLKKGLENGREAVAGIRQARKNRAQEAPKP